MHTIYNVYRVAELSCPDRAASVAAALSRLDHVIDVAINLRTGAVTVTSVEDVCVHHVVAILETAGLRLVDSQADGQVSL